MLELTCPTCNKRVQGDDASSGQSVRCPACNATMIAPGSAATAISAQPAHVRAASASSETAFREGEPPLAPAPASIRVDPLSWMKRPATWVIATVMILTAFGLLFPVVREARAKAARAQSTKNLKDIGLAFHSFHDANKRLPFNGTVPAVAADRTSGSWAFQILPFVNQTALFVRPDVNTGVPTYMCPGRGRPECSTTGAWSDYCINAWINDNLTGFENAPDARRTLVGITDGTSNTIFLGHGSVDPNLYSSSVAIPQSTDIFKGGDPATARFRTTNQADKVGDAALNWGGPFPQGALMCFGDATIRMCPYSVSGGVITKGRSDDRMGCNGWSERWPGRLAPYLTPTGSEIAGCPDT